VGSWSGRPDRTATIRVIHDQGATRTVASHFNKATKGRLLRALAESGAVPETVDDLVDALRAVGFRVEPAADPPGRRGHETRTLDVVVDAL
jgi:uncharacterized protein